MRLKAAIKGDLKQYMKAEYRTAERAVTLGIREATNGLKNAMRQQVITAGMSPRVSKTWRGDVYPRGKNSTNAAGHVYSTFEKVMSGFEHGTVIKSKDGFWLAIPTPNAPKRGRDGKRIRPTNFPEHRYGKLRFVFRSRGPSLLVVDNVQPSFRRKTGQLSGFRKASDRNMRTGRKLTTAVMFWLVPQVKMPKLIRFREEALRWHNKVPRLVLKHWD